MLFTKDEPVPAGGALGDAVFEEGAERGNAGPGPAHNDVPAAIDRKPKRARWLHVDRNVADKHLRVIGEETRGQAFLVPAVSVIAHDGDAQVRFAGIRQRRRSY